MRKIKGVVVHHSVTKDGHYSKDRHELRRIHLEKGYLDIGYHFVVEYFEGKPSVFTGRAVEQTGAHALPDKPPFLGTSPNYDYLGLCIIGDYSKEDPPLLLLEVAATAIKRLSLRHEFPLSRANVLGHSEISYTLCPGKNTMSLLYKKIGI